jgi:membrane protein
METLNRLIKRSIWQVLIWLRKIKLPGFQGMGLYDVLRFFFIALSDSKFTLLASAMSYQFFFSLFPSLLLAFLILPRFPVDNLEEKALHFILQFMPLTAEHGLDESDLYQMVQDLVGNYFDHSGSIGLIIVSIVLAFWGATRGVIAMMKAFTKQEEVFKRRNLLQLYGTALLIFGVLALVILSAVLAQIGLTTFFDALHQLDFIPEGWRRLLISATGLLITAATIFFAISVLYYLAPATRQRWKFFSPGSIAAGMLMLFAMIGLRYYFANFADFDRLYGSLGAIILLMVWFYYLSIMLLIGFELNAAIDIAAYHEDKEQREMEEAEASKGTEDTRRPPA